MRSLPVYVLRTLVLFLFWNVLSVGVLFLPVHPLLIFALEALVLAAFVWRYFLPRRRTTRAAEPPRADVVLPANPPTAVVGTRRPAGIGARERRTLLRLRPVPRASWSIVAAWVAATIVLDQLFATVYFHLVPRAADYPNPLPDLEHQPFGWLPLSVALFVAAPLVEEAAFRGWLQRPLERRIGPAWAIGVSALLFALVHGFPLLVPYYVVAGVVLGATVYLTRSLWVAIVAHAAHNLWSYGSDAIGLTNEATIELSRRSGVFAASVVALALWIAAMVWLGRRVRMAVLPRSVGRSAPRPAAILPARGL